MNLSHVPNLAFSSRARGCDIAEQPTQQRGQVEASVESIRKCAEVVAGVLVEYERLVAAIDHRLEISQDGVDPGELREVTRLAPANDDVGVRTASVNDAGEAVQAFATNVRAGQQIGLGPVGDGFPGETGHRGELHAHGAASLVGGHGRDDGHLVWRTAANNAGTFAAEVGIVDLHVPGERLPGHLARPWRP